jgi:hypothetical protein
MVNTELKVSERKRSLSNFRSSPGICLDVLRKTTKTVGQGSRCSGPQSIFCAKDQVLQPYKSFRTPEGKQRKCDFWDVRENKTTIEMDLFEGPIIYCMRVCMTSLVDLARTGEHSKPH